MYLITEIDMRNGTFIPVTRIIPSPVCSLEWSAEFVHRWRIVYPSCGMPGRAAIGDIALPMKIRGEPGIVRRTHANKESVIVRARVTERKSPFGFRQCGDEGTGHRNKNQEGQHPPRKSFPQVCGPTHADG